MSFTRGILTLIILCSFPIMSAAKVTLMQEDKNYCNPLAVGSALNNTTLAAAIASTSSPDCSGNKVLLVTPGTWTIAANLTIPDRFAVEISQGALLSINAGQTLTLDCRKLIASTYPVFAGSGSVSCSNTPYTVAYAASITFAADISSVQGVVLTGNITSITLSQAAALLSRGSILWLRFTQDGTGTRTVTGWPGSVLWSSGSAPVITVGANITTLIGLVFDGTNWRDIPVGAGSGTGDITDVWGCTSGNCNALTAVAGDSLDVGSADTSRPATRSTSLPGTCQEGQQHQDTDSGGSETYLCTATNTWLKIATTTDTVTDAQIPDLDTLSSGLTASRCVETDGSGFLSVTGAPCGSGSGDVTQVWGCTTGDCSILTGAAGDSLDAGSADTSKPATRSTTLSGTCTEGQQHQDTDSGGSETYICTATNTWIKVANDTDVAANTAAIAANLTTVHNWVGSSVPVAWSLAGNCIGAIRTIPAAGGAQVLTITCTNVATDCVYATLLLPPVGWVATNGLIVRGSGVHIGTPSGEAFGLTVAAQCRTDESALNNTWGTSQTLTIAFDTIDQLETVNSPTLTPNGTCSGGTETAPMYVNVRACINTGAYVCATPGNCLLTDLEVRFVSP